MGMALLRPSILLSSFRHKLEPGASVQTGSATKGAGQTRAIHGARATLRFRPSRLQSSKRSRITAVRCPEWRQERLRFPGSRALLHRAEPRSREIDPRRLAGDVQQHLRVGFVETHGGNLVPAEERWLAQPFRVGGDFLQGEAVVLDAQRTADVADLVLVLGIHVHAHNRRNCRPRCCCAIPAPIRRAAWRHAASGADSRIEISESCPWRHSSWGGQGLPGRQFHSMYRDRSSFEARSLRFLSTYSASIEYFSPLLSAASNEMDSNRRSITVCRRRAPMFSVLSFTLKATSASLAIPSPVNSSFTPSVFSIAVYCLVSALWGSERIRSKSLTDNADSSTRIGRRPCNSGIRSDGLAIENAPEAMNSTWSVLTGPYLVETVEP